MHRYLRSNRSRPNETSPMPPWRPQESRPPYPVSPMPLQGEHQPRSTRGGSLHRASFRRQAQVVAERPPLWQLAIEEQTSPTESLAEQNLPEQALEGRTGQEKNPPKHPQTRHRQLDLEQLEQTMLEMRKLQKVVRKLVAKLPPTFAAELAEDECKTESDSNSSNNNNNTDNNNNNTTNTNNNNNNNNNEPNNYNNNSKNSRESSLNSLDLNNDNPESEPDLDAESFGSFNPILGAESILDQHEANLSLGNLGHITMAIGSSLGSLIQQQHK